MSTHDEVASLSAEAGAAPTAIRKRAAIALPLTAIPFVGCFFLFDFLKEHFTGPGVLVLPAVLALPLMLFTLELTTGLPFMALATKWDQLKGWQRGVIGVTLVVGLLGLLVVMLVMAAKMNLL
jgi:hypothetical protein